MFSIQRHGTRKKKFLSRHFAWHFEELFWLGCEIKQRIWRWFCGYSAQTENPDAGIIVELKYARSLHDLDQACERALEQIEDRRYDTELREDGRNDILAYGIAFCRKRCKVVVKKL